MNSAPTALALSRLTGRPVAPGSAVAMQVAPVQAADAKVERVPSGLQQILRPNASTRWILPQLASITPTYIEGVLRGAFTGSHIQAWELFDLMEDTWPRLSKNLNELKRAVVAMDWKLEAWAEEDMPPTEAAQERARLVSSALWRMQPDPCADENGFQQTIYDVLDAWGKGVSVIEILWHIRRAGPLGDITAPRATVWVRPNNYAWSQEGRLGLNPNALDRGSATRSNARAYLTTPSYFSQPTDLVEFPEDKFLIGIAKAKTGPAIVGALLRPLAWWWCAGNFSADWLMNLAQVFGLPFRWANYASGSSQNTIDAICNMLTNMGSAGWAAFPEGTTLELKEASKSGENSPQGDLLERADKNCDLLILGQTLTSDTGGMGAGGGSLALGKVHAGVKEQNILAAANWAAEVINRQLIPSILRLNYGDEEEAPEFNPEPDLEEDQQANASRDTTLLAAGVEMPKEWFYKRHGIPLPQKGEDVIGGKEEPEASPSPGGEGRGEGEPVEEEDEEAEQEPTTAKAALPRVQQVSLEEFSRALAQDFQPVARRLEAILKIQDGQLFADKLNRFLGDMERIKTDILRDPGAAHALEQIISTGLANGLAEARKRK